MPEMDGVEAVKGTNPYGCVGILVGWSKDVTVDGCDIAWVYRGDQDFDGIGFDFEGGGLAENITLKNSTIRYTDGCGIYIFRNPYGGTKNCIVENCTISYFGQNPGQSQGVFHNENQQHNLAIFLNSIAV